MNINIFYITFFAGSFKPLGEIPIFLYSLLIFFKCFNSLKKKIQKTQRKIVHALIINYYDVLKLRLNIFHFDFIFL